MSSTATYIPTRLVLNNHVDPNTVSLQNSMPLYARSECRDNRQLKLNCDLSLLIDSLKDVRTSILYCTTTFKTTQK